MKYVIAISNSDPAVTMYRVEASSQRDALVKVLQPLEGYEGWNWDFYPTYTSLARAMLECGLAVAIEQV